MGAAESYRNAGEAPGVEGLDPLYPVRALPDPTQSRFMKVSTKIYTVHT